ncbi:TPR-like protein [Gigaspora margarita]|uniref:Tetratricopeptide repeat and J domain-containing co-chaperone DNJ1 n=2 Tax=Gigaspora margarita TaxID=4874 RepID=A0A8H4A0K6_GIGMA|nr:TPR-like protein [Gigaspora margarita]
MKVYRLVLAFLPLLLSTTSLVFCDKSAQQYFDEGNEFFADQKYEEAVKSYASAINQNPNDYLYYFKRALTYLALERSSSALQDFTTILGLKPDFDKALLQRAKIYIKEGSLTEAKSDLQKYLQKNEQDVEGQKSLISINSAEKYISTAEEAINSENYDACVENMFNAIKISPHSPRLRLTRAQCHLSKGEVEEGVRDLSSASQLIPEDPALSMRLCLLNYFSLYNPKQALQSLKQCLHYDPENKECKTLHRFIKKIEKEVERVNNDIEGHRWKLAINKLLEPSTKGLINDVEEELQNLNEGRQRNELLVKLYGWTCKAYKELKEVKKALKWCDKTLKLDENNVETLINRAEVLLDEEDYEAALNDYKKAHDLTQGLDNRIKQGYAKADRLLKQSKKKDYYKILGVSRKADKKEIKRAYRKLAQEWHPDKYKGDLSQDQVAVKMSAINEAYEVLSDDELRARFDNGEDPNDPNNGGSPFFYSDNNPFMQQFGGFPFSGFPFSSGGESSEGQYQFHFNFP